MAKPHRYFLKLGSIAGFTLLLGIGGVFIWHCFTSSQATSPDALISGPFEVFSQPKQEQPPIGGSFTLTDHTGKTRTHHDFLGQYTLVYFGYTFCPDICPTGLSTITEALNLLGKKAEKIQPLFITVDPERDTPQQLALYLQNFHARFIGLTGTPQQIKDVIKAYKVYAAKATPDGTSTEYLMDHSSIIYVMDPRGQFIAHFNHETPAQEIVKALETLL